MGGQMGTAPQGVEALSRQASTLRESLLKSQNNTDAMVSILGSFDRRLSALETTMRPTQVRTHAIRRAHENIDKTLKSAAIILAQFDLSREAEAKILKGPHEDLESYLEAVEQLRSNVRFFSSNKNFKSSDGVLNHANNLLSRAILKLDDEFRQLLSNYSKPLEPENLVECLPNSLRLSTEPQGNHLESNSRVSPASNVLEHHNKNSGTIIYKPLTLIYPRILPLLHELAQQMVHAGHRQQCFKIYKENRSFVMEQTLRKLGVEKLTKEDVQKMQWEILEAKIGNWTVFIRVAVVLLFSGERKICDQIFNGMDSLNDQCFSEVTASSLSLLLSFGDAIARSKRSPEKLFVLLDMFESMHELQPEIERIFAGKAFSEMRDSMFTLTRRLGQTAQDTFGDFEEAVEKDVSKTTVLDGAVHPLTSYVINYVKFLYDYQSTFKLLFQESQDADETNSQFANMTIRIMNALQSNLEGKSKQYKDPALAYIFLMNNIHYMVRSVRRSEAKDLLGDDWVQRQRRVVQQNANQYRRVAWTKLMQSLTIQVTNSTGGDGIPGSQSMGNSSGVSRATVKERFKSFNTQFEELHQRQSQWCVPDLELRESLKLSIAEVLLPAYRSFIKRFGPLIDCGKNPQKYYRHAPEDVERLLGEFFEAKVWGDVKR
ncbi:exocyst complex component EXO70A1-like [Wolffia australiana]